MRRLGEAAQCVERVGWGLGTGTEFQAISAADFGSVFLLMVG